MFKNIKDFMDFSVDDFKDLKNEKYNLIAEREISFEDKKKDQELNHNKQDHSLKIWTAIFLIFLLFLQSISIFVLVFLQGFKFKNFNLSEYIFYILISGVLTESYFLVKIVVRHLFPLKDGENESNNSSLQKP